MKNILVLGAGGFIGNALVSRLINQGHYVRGVDIKHPDFNNSAANEFLLLDLRDVDKTKMAITINEDCFDEIYHLAADMGGADYIFTGKHDADIISNSITITVNLLTEQVKLNQELGKNKTKIFYSSSACVYPQHNQTDPENPDCKEDSVYPANPDSDYGFEKLFSERLFKAYARNYNIPIRIARYHNVYGPLSAYDGGREKAPAALCRKVLQAQSDIVIYGDGNQTRSFLYIEDALDATLLLMDSDYADAINIGSEEMISINDFVDMIMSIEGKSLNKIHQLSGPTGVRGRTSNNDLIKKTLDWTPKVTLKEGITNTYIFIKSQIKA